MSCNSSRRRKFWGDQGTATSALERQCRRTPVLRRRLPQHNVSGRSRGKSSVRVLDHRSVPCRESGSVSFAAIPVTPGLSRKRSKTPLDGCARVWCVRVCVPLCFHALLVIPSPSDNSSELSVRALFIVFFLLSSGTACRTLSVHSSFRPHHNFFTTSLPPPPLLLLAPCYGPTTSSPHKRRHFLSLTRQTFNLSGPSRMRTEPKRYRRCARTWIHWRSAWQRFHALWTLREMKEQSFCARSPVYRLGW